MSKHGIPSIIYKSDIQEEIYIQNIESYLSNFSSNSYIFANKSDDISLIEASNSSNQSFRDTISDSNKEIGEIICGSNISSQQSFVGSAEVHERLLTMYTESDKRFLETVVNDQLIPKLIGLGLTFLEGVKFEFEEEEEDNTALFAKTVQLLQLGYSVDPQWIADNFGIPVVSPTIINSGDISKNNSEEDV
jgi:phage gp29-like protein